MRFEWNFIRDFIVGYLLKKVLLLAIVFFSTVAGIMYLILVYVLDRYFTEDEWSSILIALSIAMVLLVQGIVYYRIAKRLIPGERIEKYLKKIAELREEGVNNLLNVDKSTIKTEVDYNAFHARFVEWRDRLIPEIEKISPSQASIFKVLGTFPFTEPIDGFPDVTKYNLAFLLGIIREYTNRIKDMVDRFSLENLSNRVKQ